MPKIKINPLPNLKDSIAEFLLDRQVRRVSPRTIEWHTYALGKWLRYCEGHGVSHPTSVTSAFLRAYVFDLQSNHKQSGVSSIYRSLRTYLLWYEEEFQPRGWQSPTRKVKVGKGDDDILDPIPLSDFAALIATCQRRTYTGDRDRAILYTLLDTGIRRQELADLHLTDVNLTTGALTIRRGKGGDPRTVYLGANSRRTMMQYLRIRNQQSQALWLTDDGEPLTNSGIRQILRRRADRAKIPEPGLHSFRRAFALNFLRNGGDVLSLQRLLGHASLDIINRYVKMLNADVAAAHKAHGVVDNL